MVQGTFITASIIHRPQPLVGGQTDPVSVKVVVDTVRYALVGNPTFHAKQQWEFDPDVAKRRSNEFQAINGYKSMGLIERLGLGIDGRQEERRIEQRIRDRGLNVAYKR